MEANELRIGNLVNGTGMNGCYYDGINFIVLSVSSDSIKLAPKKSFIHLGQGGFLVHPKNLSGIPLTPEWLERLGFNLDRDHFKTEGRFPIYCDFKIWARNVDSDGEWKVNHNGDDLTYVRYVHQLQNLYYALTGEELILKEELQ